MNSRGLVATVVTTSILSTYGRATFEARERAQKVFRDDQLRVQAWFAANTELAKACAPPTTRTDCAPRYVKKTPWVREVDDWESVPMPSYEVIVAVHEHAIRHFTPDPPVYIEYTIGAARYLAAKTDAGVITPEGFRQAFSEVWRWMAGQLRGHQELVLQNLREAEATQQQVLAAIGVGLAVALGVALVAAGGSEGYAPSPSSAVPAIQQPQVIQPSVRPAVCARERNPTGIIPNYVIVCR